ncbi:MAG: hypothetical protein AAF628_20385 [Planctomycetota bacterium]
MRRSSHVLVSIAVLSGAGVSQSDAPARRPDVEESRAPSTTRHARRTANENAAASSLRVLYAAQAQCQASAVIDADADGVGEFAYFAELAGAVPVRDPRGGDLRIAPPILARSMGLVTSSIVVRQGYCFAMFLPDAKGRPIAEAPRGGSPRGAEPDPQRAARHWCAYAWPERFGVTGQRAFFVNQDGELLACDNEASKYSGTARRPAPLAAYRRNSADMAAVVSPGVPAHDGHKWTTQRTAAPARRVAQPPQPQRRRSLLGSLFGRRRSQPQGEAAAIATLRNVASAQAQCQASAVIDEDANGAGEYGYFAELAGACNVRGSDQRLVPPVLSVAFGQVEQSVVTRGGYCFAMFLPDASGRPTGEAKDGGAAESRPDPATAGVLWCCYAWPLEYGRTGRRAFLIDQAGDVLATANHEQRYSGRDRRPDPLAAFAPGGKAIKPGKPAGDGGVWAPITGASPR